MATKDQLKNWFRTNLYPTEVQFAEWLDSYWHKDEQLPMSAVSGLVDAINNKVDKKAIALPDVYDADVPYVFNEDEQQYVSFQNEASGESQFQTEGFYRLIEDAPVGENPETNPEHWKYQGATWGEITIADVAGLVGELEALRNSSGGGGGSAYLLNVAEVPTYNADGSVRIIKQSYVADPAKYFEQRFEYANGLVSKVEKKDDMIEKWVQETGLFDVNGQLLKPSIVDITDWTIL